VFPLIETAIAFAAAMFAASLFVSAAVQMLQKVGRYGSTTVREMLEALLSGFRDFHNDPLVIAAEHDRPTEDMLRDALRAYVPAKPADGSIDWPDADDQTLHADGAAEPAGGAVGVSTPRAELRRRIDGEIRQFAGDVLSDGTLHSRRNALEYRDDPERLAKLVEYVDAADLKRLASSWARYYAGKANLAPSQPDATLDPDAAESRTQLPVQWVGPLLARSKTTRDFERYVETWFATFEGTASERFKKKIRRLTLVVSALVVVIFNLDGIHLLRELNHNAAGRQALVEKVESLQTTAARLGVAGTELGPDELDATEKELALELQKTALSLDEAGVGIGWQDSWIVERFCAYREACASVAPKPSGWRLLLDSGAWLGGLTFAWVLLSLGAPFWYGALSGLINTRNAVRARKETEAEEAKADAPAG
jgi:hypothetical protein